MVLNLTGAFSKIIFMVILSSGEYFNLDYSTFSYKFRKNIIGVENVESFGKPREEENKSINFMIFFLYLFVYTSICYRKIYSTNRMFLINDSCR